MTARSATELTGITDVVAAANHETLTYTDQSRLSGATSAVSLYGTRLWTYDPNGNRLSETATG